MKKVLSLVLVIAMVLSSFSFAFAANFEDVEGDYEDAINTLVALGVVTGYEDGTFKPERVVTRAEMAKLIVEILGYGDLVAGSKSNFADTQGHWADPWIALAAGRGLVIGTGDGNFTPDRTVSYDEAITMIVRALGYSDNSNELAGMTWPTNFKVKAAELGLTKNVALNAAGADRGGVAILLYNALEAELVTVNTDGDVVFSGKELLSRLAELDEDYVVSSELFDPTNKNYAGDMVDLAPYIYQSLKVYLNDDDEVVYIKDSNSLVIEGEIDEVTLSKSGKVATVAIETADGSIKKLDFTVDEDEGLDTELPGSVFENRASKSEATFKYLNDEPETVKIVANEGDKSNGKIEEDEVVGFVLETQTKVAKVEEEYEKGDDKFDVFTLPTNSKGEPNFNKIIVKGDADSLEDIEVDDVVVEYLAEDDAFTTLVVSRDTVEGEVTRIGETGETDIYVDGTKYKLSGTFGADDSILLGDTGIFFLDHNGKIVAFDGDAAGATDYAVVLGVEPGKIDEGRFGKTAIDDYPQLKVVTQEGEEVIYDVYVKVKSEGTEISDSAKYTGTDGKTADLFTAITKAGEDKVITSAKFGALNPVAKDFVVTKIKLNSNDQITKIEVIADKTVKDLDTTKSSFKLADNALIFDIGEEEAVSESKLSPVVDGSAVYNKNGQIEVLLTNDVDGYNYTFAYITKAEEARQGGEDVQALVAYVNGEKVDPLYTDDDDVVKDGIKKVYALDLSDDNIVKDAKLASKVTTGSGLEVYSKVTAKGISSSNRTIQLASGWETLAEDVTIIGVDEDDAVNAVRRLSSITRNESVLDVYVYDGEVVFIVIFEDYDEESDAPDPDPATGEVTYIVDGYNKTFARFDLEDRNGEKVKLFVADFDGFELGGVEVSEAVMTAWLAEAFAEGSEFAPTSIDVTEDNVLIVEGERLVINQTKNKAYETIQDAIDDAVEGNNVIVVYPGDHGTESINIIQKPGVNITLEAVGEVVLKNQIKIDGAGRFNGAESLTIKGFTFDFSDATGDIIATAKIDSTNYVYAHNIFIEDCVFIGNSDNVVAVKAYAQGGHYNFRLKGCTGTNLHSLAQLTSVTGVKVQDCNVIDAIEGGLNLQNSTNIVIDNLTVDGTEYGVRAGQGSGTVNTLNTMTISDSELNAKYPIWLRGDAPGTVIITDSTLTPSDDGEMIYNVAGTVNITIDGATYVTTEEELRTALNDPSVSAITLGKDIEIAVGSDYVVIGRPVKLDGNNKTIFGVKTNNGPVLHLDSNNIEIKHVTIKSKEFNSDITAINIAGGGRTGIVIDDVTFENTGYGVYANPQSYVTITNNIFKNLNSGIGIEGYGKIEANEFSKIKNNYVENASKNISSDSIIAYNNFDTTPSIDGINIKPAQ